MLHTNNWFQSCKVDIPPNNFKFTAILAALSVAILEFINQSARTTSPMLDVRHFLYISQSNAGCYGSLSLIYLSSCSFNHLLISRVVPLSVRCLLSVTLLLHEPLLCGQNMQHHVVILSYTVLYCVRVCTCYDYLDPTSFSFPIFWNLSRWFTSHVLKHGWECIICQVLELGQLGFGIQIWCYYILGVNKQKPLLEVMFTGTGRLFQGVEQFQSRQPDLDWAPFTPR